jgi:hypothetical protein
VYVADGYWDFAKITTIHGSTLYTMCSKPALFNAYAAVAPPVVVGNDSASRTRS